MKKIGREKNNNIFLKMSKNTGTFMFMKKKVQKSPLRKSNDNSSEVKQKYIFYVLCK